MKWWMRKKRSREEEEIFQIDFEKAYDHVDWVFWTMCLKGKILALNGGLG